MIVNSVRLELSIDEAFELFVARIDDWWPAERRHTQDASSRIFLQASGRFYERSSDGVEIELGKVTHWDAPRLIVLDIYIATGPQHPTEAEIRFDVDGGGTRVTVSHRPKPESAHLWDERSPRYDTSWQVVLGALRRHANGEGLAQI